MKKKNSAEMKFLLLEARNEETKTPEMRRERIIKDIRTVIVSADLNKAYIA